MYKAGKLEGQEVTDILLDTGCSRTMVHRNLVAMEKVIVGKVATITCAHGDTKLHPLALVELKWMELIFRWKQLYQRNYLCLICWECIVSCSKIVCCDRRRMICDGCSHQEQFNLYTHARFEV